MRDRLRVFAPIRTAPFLKFSSNFRRGKRQDTENLRRLPILSFPSQRQVVDDRIRENLQPPKTAPMAAERPMPLFIKRREAPEWTNQRDNHPRRRPCHTIHHEPV